MAAPAAPAEPAVKGPVPDSADASSPAPVITRNVVPEPRPPPDAEVEFFGEVLLGKLKPSRIVFVVNKGPCESSTTSLEVLEQMDVSPGPLFTEMFFPQGTVGYLCAIALDAKGRQVGFARHSKGALTFQGEGEVEVKDVTLRLEAVKPRPAPQGL